MKQLVIFFILSLFYIPAAAESTEYKGILYTKLAENIWMHTTYHKTKNWGKVRSNGLIVLTKEGALLIDTGWNNTQTQHILNWVHEELETTVTAAVFTHAHDDKMGGVQAVIDAGAKTFAHPLSNQFAPNEDLTPAEYNLQILSNGDAVAAHPAFDGIKIFYPGGGHTRDNIVVALPTANILFGGCLIRPGKSHSLGNTATADIKAWATSVKNVANRFPDTRLIVPSHGDPSGRKLLDHTIKLAQHTVSE
ncbi:subclass B1 metallo-beta-lactamase [Kordiimonas laminariae]|uniref:subclass B1 metallo-beta-lactamase n=1 Tax=Kordiimonas laminariae TaxID=2917717 RepID=UPI001FF6EA61|nr:subclass B1 metallo-beta-lactamase [Kordiimonas laminariae]MCK0068983.1 subclass B1 metallo-beta-lactamase [Kordiimonas laminariae]